MSLTSFLPQDRLRAIARNQAIPDHADGSVLFADISGFTPLTEGLQQALGPRQGAEALSDQLEAVYTAVIAEVERFSGSVVSFAGDAITCWFDDALGAAAKRAMAAASAMQTAMQAFAEISLPGGSRTALGLKVTIASGPIRRFVAGDPQIGLLDNLAGATVSRTAAAEHLARRGEILVDEPTQTRLGDPATVEAWRRDEDTGHRFAVIVNYSEKVDPLPLSTPADIPEETLKPWLQQPIAAWVQSGQSGFLTEFRPCTAMFVRFIGIDYDTGGAAGQLDAFVRLAQSIVTGEDGLLLQITIGDKGSYAHINFGALNVHEDGPRRAVRTAQKLLEDSAALNWPASLQIGIAHGTMWVGAYGGRTRRIYSGLGDDVNLAARLMETAGPGEVLTSGRVYKATARDFIFEPRSPLHMKGKAEPLPVFAVTGVRLQRAMRLQEPAYALPMIGRQAELAEIEGRLDLALSGQAQVVAVVAEAGIGKSRLVAEVIRSARGKGYLGYGGACLSDSVHVPYLAWKSIWGAFFSVDPELPLRRQIRWLEAEIEDRAPQRLESLPLLGRLLDVPIPENEFTENLEPKIRQSLLHALLEECLQAEVAGAGGGSPAPILIVIEDAHWIDALSFDLLEELCTSLAGHPVCFVLAYRPQGRYNLAEDRLVNLPHFTRIELHELDRSEAELAIRAKLAQLYPARSGALPADLVQVLMERSQGNPFYLEELLNYLRDRGLDPRDPADLEKIALPDSLHTLILSRIDQLAETEKNTLRVASIIGRLFRARWLTGYYPDLGDPQAVKADLDALDRLDITPLESVDPELTYLFRHIVTQEVAYESLPFSTRANLHQMLAAYLEGNYPDRLPLDALAFHYGRAENAPKAFQYSTLAGDSAFRLFALEGTLSNYERALEWAGPANAGRDEIIHLYRQRGRALELSMRHPDALSNFQELEALGESRGDDRLRLAGIAGQGSVYGYGLLDSAKAQSRSEEALALARRLGDRRTEANSLWNLMNSFFWEDAARALAYGESGLAVAQDLAADPDAADQDFEQLALILLDFSFPLIGTGRIDLAVERIEKSRRIFERLGNLPMVATSGQRLGIVLKEEGRLDQAAAVFKGSIAIDRSIGNGGGIISTSIGLLDLYPYQGDAAAFFAILAEIQPISAREGRFPIDVFDLYPIFIYEPLGLIEPIRRVVPDLLEFLDSGVPILPETLMASAAVAFFRAGDLQTGQNLLEKVRIDGDMDSIIYPLTYKIPQARAELALATGELEAGLGEISNLLEKLNKSGARRHLPVTLLLKGRILEAGGRAEEARSVLSEARTIAANQKARPALWRICARLAGLEEPETAQALFSEARSAVEFIAEHAGSQELRDAFLGLPEIQAVLSKSQGSQSGSKP